VRAAGGAGERAAAGVSALDDHRRYAAAVSKDPRFDGVFFTAVTSTGI
jgi:methylphosphotriester-DNA--protein-cysteine methyltransferase